MNRFLVLFIVLALGSFVMGQTVLEVPSESDGQPIINALTQYVVADTNQNGEQLHDIYKLQRGKTYFYNQSPVFKNPITLIADPPGDTDETKPPQLLITTDDEGGTNQTIINVYISQKLLIPDPELIITFPTNNQTVSGVINITGIAYVYHYSDEIVDVKILIKIKNNTKNEEFIPTIYTEDTYDYIWYYNLDTNIFYNGKYDLKVILINDFNVEEEIQIEIQNS